MLGINLKVMVFWACCCKIQEEMRAEARKTYDNFRTRKKKIFKRRHLKAVRN